MKKFIVALTCATLLSSCAYLDKKYYEMQEQSLAQEKNVIKTLDVFRTKCHFYPRNNLFLIIHLSENKEAACCDYINENANANGSYSHHTFEECGMSGDKCKIFRRNNKTSSNICYFNYKKYLPEGVANSEKEFLVLYNKFEEIFTRDDSNKASACEYNNDLTQLEKQQCNEKARKDFTVWAMSGGAKKQINNEIKQAQIAEQKKKEQQAIAKAKTEAQKADCKQAKEKAQKRLEQIKTALGMKSNEKNLRYSLIGKVVDFADNGIIISTDCSGIWANGWMFGTFGTLMAANCEEERTFVYTKNTDYATNEKFNNKGLLYKKVGNFRYTTVTGATMSIPAYRETPYKASEIDYKTYLKDKSIKYCN